MQEEELSVDTEIILKAEASLAKAVEQELEKKDPTEEEAARQLEEAQIVYTKRAD